MIRFSFVLLFMAVSSLVCGCSQQTSTDAHAEEERTIHGLENELIEALVSKDLDRFVSLYADDATIFYPNLPPITGRDALHAGWEEMLARPGFKLDMQAAGSEVSRSGDLAYAYGTFALAFNENNGATVTEKGNYIVIFKKQPDGQWKIIMDMATPDHPVSEASAEQAADVVTMISPDGKWIASMSKDPERPEIYIRPAK